MKILPRYVGITVISAILLVALILVGIQSFIQLAAQLQDVGKGHYGWWTAIGFVPMMLPSDLYQLFPMAALIGSLIGLGRLASQSELVVMRASGMSKWEIIRGVMFAASVMLLVVSLIGEGFAPYARDIALQVKSNALGRESTQSLQGTWVRDHDQFFHIKKVISPSALLGITRYQFDEKHRLQLASYANRAMLEDGQWVFYDVQQTLFNSGHIEEQSHAKQSWPLKLKSEEFLLNEVDPHQQTLVKLYKFLHVHKHSGIGTGTYEFVFWQRIFQPLATLVMIFLAVPVVFGPLRSVNMGHRIVVGVIFGFIFYILNQFLGPFSLVYQVPPLIAAALPMILFALLASYLLTLKN